MFWIWAKRSISMRSLVAIRAKPSKQWPATAAPELTKDPGMKVAPVSMVSAKGRSEIPPEDHFSVVTPSIADSKLCGQKPRHDQR